MRYLLLSLSLVLLPALNAGCGAKQADADKSPVEAPLFERVCSAREAMAAAKEGGAVVLEGFRCTAGQELMEDFYATATAGQPAQVLIVQEAILDPDSVDPTLYAQEKDKYPIAFLYLLLYDGEAYHLKARLSVEKNLDMDVTYAHLLHFTEDPSSDNVFALRGEAYVLVDDPTATWEGIISGMISCSMGGGYRHSTVYHTISD